MLNSKAQDYESQVNEMKSLCDSLERTKEELLRRLENKTGQCYDEAKLMQSTVQKSNNLQLTI